MLACENRGCNRRFCEHCLNTHIADQSSSLEWRRRGVPWHCPICRKTCCCAMRECSKTHRHCKAYRYRRKRAQQSEVETSPTPEVSSLQQTEHHLHPHHLHLPPHLANSHFPHPTGPFGLPGIIGAMHHQHLMRPFYSAGL
mmetsp:Transcript_12301/g.28414  ORF Transcript_12301/g.28414 Transcript_12301/m.28414 type:complete len:141 (-) Transcript_12301:61-483(-)